MLNNVGVNHMMTITDAKTISWFYNNEYSFNILEYDTTTPPRSDSKHFRFPVTILKEFSARELNVDFQDWASRSNLVLGRDFTYDLKILSPITKLFNGKKHLAVYNMTWYFTTQDQLLLFKIMVP